jgi:enamine deaminase RidA (YjgF/YER057c/UK114 family)
VGVADMRAQAKQTFANIREILALAGATMDDVVKITAFITDIAKYGHYSEIRAQTFTRNVPASSTVAVSGLINPDLLLEVEAVAFKPL